MLLRDAVVAIAAGVGVGFLHLSVITEPPASAEPHIATQPYWKTHQCRQVSFDHKADEVIWRCLSNRRVKELQQQTRLEAEEIEK